MNQPKHKPFMDCLVPEDDPADLLYDLWRESQGKLDNSDPDLGDTVYDMDRDEA